MPTHSIVEKLMDEAARVLSATKPPRAHRERGSQLIVDAYRARETSKS